MKDTAKNSWFIKSMWINFLVISILAFFKFFFEIKTIKFEEIFMLYFMIFLVTFLHFVTLYEKRVMMK